MSSCSWRARHAALLVVLTCALGGCVTLPQSAHLAEQWPADLPARIELAGVPFHAQREYECGPAALAMVMDAAGLTADVDALVREVYLPARRGSLQAEMLAAPRRHGLLTAVLPGRLEDVLREVSAGTPVIILQNYGLGTNDLWHYAVVVGHDADARELILRSGDRERLSLSWLVFEWLWQKGRHWAMVAVPSDRVPATATEERHREATLALARVAPDAARAAYAAAVRRWPDSVTARIAYANALHDAHDYAAAAAQLAAARERDPDSPLVLNNLAQTLSDLGRHAEALALIERALRAPGPFTAAIAETRATIVERMGKASP